MSISRKSSFDTIVTQKAHDDPLQFFSNTGDFRKDLDLKGLSDSARKSFAALKPWQSATVCFYHPSTTSIVGKVVERVDECHAAIQTTLAAAQMGRAFADDVAALCDTLSQKQQSPERLNELLSKLIITAEKGYGRSIQAQGQLMCARLGVLQISESIPLQISAIEVDNLKRQAENTPTTTSFNGINTCFVTLVPPAITDAEETDIWKSPPTSTTWPIYIPSSYLTFQSVIAQLDSIATDILLFTQQIGRCVDWWNRMKSGMETLKISFLKIDQDEPHSLRTRMSSVAEGWQGVADQFALYVHKTDPVVKDYLPNSHLAGGYATPYVGPYNTQTYAPPPRPCRRWSRSRSRSRSYSPRRPSAPPPVVVTGDLPSETDATVHVEKSKPLWKRLSCIS